MLKLSGRLGLELAQQSHAADAVEMPAAHGVRLGAIPLHLLHLPRSHLPDLQGEVQSTAMDAYALREIGTRRRQVHK